MRNVLWAIFLFAVAVVSTLTVETVVGQQYSAPYSAGRVASQAPTSMQTKSKDATENETKSHSPLSWLPRLPNPWSSKKAKPDETEPADDGLERVAAINQERRYSEQDYIVSAIQPTGTAAKECYLAGIAAERQGNVEAAMQSYHQFIQSNKNRTQNGVLAAPYHRLAMIFWKHRNDARNADICFRYAIKYAQGANFLIVTGDFALFFMERGEWEQAEILLRNGLLQDHGNQRLLVHLARCKAGQDRPVEAMRYLSQVYGKEQGYVELAVMYRQQGNHVMARGIEEKREHYLASVQQPAQIHYAARPVPEMAVSEVKTAAQAEPVQQPAKAPEKTASAKPAEPPAKTSEKPAQPAEPPVTKTEKEVPAKTAQSSPQPAVVQTTYTAGSRPVKPTRAAEISAPSLSDRQETYRAQY